MLCRSYARSLVKLTDAPARLANGATVLPLVLIGHPAKLHGYDGGICDRRPLGLLEAARGNALAASQSSKAQARARLFPEEGISTVSGGVSSK